MKDVDHYLGKIPVEQRVVLEHIRQLVRTQVPEATETISYGMPTFKYRGKSLLHYAAFKNHLSLFATGDPNVQALGTKVEKYRTSKGTLQFSVEEPIPDDVIVEIISVRMRSINKLWPT